MLNLAWSRPWPRSLVDARIMHRLIPGSQLHVYRGGHLDLIAEPLLLAPVIERFLDR